MDEKVLDEILATDKRIRYVGILGEDLKTVLSKSRKRVRLKVAKEYVDEILVRFSAPVLLGAMARLSDKCGRLICAGVRYEGLTVMSFMLGKSYVVVTTDPVPPYAIMQKLMKKFKA